MEREQPDRGLALAVDAAGSQSALGRVIGRRQSTIWDRLRSGKPIWAEDVLTVEAELGVSRHDLRPDLYPLDAFPTPAPVAAHSHDVAFDRAAVSKGARA